jgi:hypothetical protein
MRSINIENSLHDDILDFCKVNEINDVDDFINKTLRKGFDLKKYGESFAMFFNKTESDMIFNGPPVEQAPIVESEVTEQPKKKGGRKKKVVEPIAEQEPEPEVVIEQPKEPVYEIKQEEPKPVKKPVTLIKKQPRDNYDVYDEI